MDGDINLEQDHKQELTDIKIFIKRMKAKLEGYEWAGNEKYYQTNEAIASNDIISVATGLLESFTHESNLLTMKSDREFALQVYRTSMTFLDYCINSNGMRVEYWKSVWRIFKNAIENIGDIILGSKSIVSDMLTQAEKDKGITGL